MDIDCKVQNENTFVFGLMNMYKIPCQTSLVHLMIHTEVEIANVHMPNVPCLNVLFDNRLSPTDIDNSVLSTGPVEAL